ncbi:MAG: LacI family DNA-binding transcriptional regulator [Anaerolineaceae bacterium]|jgi:LacI family transcriptional regulator|nr:LacI family DNA-binding transcriptional regulator [Anaerolineaceae bacterium]
MGSTIKDVADRAGVSITTVSHVINKTRFVSDELRDRVQRAMDELGYRPNNLARSLRMGATRSIGLVVPDNSNPFFAEIARYIEDIGFTNGYSVFLCNSDSKVDKELAYINTLIAKMVDGVIFITSASTPEHIQALNAYEIPVVVVDRRVPSALADVVLVNNELGGYLATHCLIKHGHRRIACITGPSALTPSADRVLGFRRAMQEAGLPVNEAWLATGNFRADGGETAMCEILAAPEHPTAVFACNDMMAIGALRMLRGANLKVPEDISVVGYDDIPIAAQISPALTTVAQPVEQMASIATQLLLSRIQNERGIEQTEQHMLDPRLVLRDSCALLP